MDLQPSGGYAALLAEVPRDSAVTFSLTERISLNWRNERVSYYTLRQEKWVDFPVPPIDRSGVCARSVDVANARACRTHRGGTMLGIVSIQ